MFAACIWTTVVQCDLAFYQSARLIVIASGANSNAKQKLDRIPSVPCQAPKSFELLSPTELNLAVQEQAGSSSSTTRVDRHQHLRQFTESRKRKASACRRGRAKLSGSIGLSQGRKPGYRVTLAQERSHRTEVTTHCTAVVIALMHLVPQSSPIECRRLPVLLELERYGCSIWSGAVFDSAHKETNSLMQASLLVHSDSGCCEVAPSSFD